MARRAGTFLDRIIEGVVVVCSVIFFMGGQVSFAVIGGVAVVLRIYRLWLDVSRRGAR